MPYENHSSTHTPAQDTAVNAAFDAIRDNLPFLINLTPEERQGRNKMGPDSFSFVTRALSHAAQNPQVLSAWMNLPEGQRDLAAANQLRLYFQQAASLFEAIQDTMMATGGEAKTFANDIYGAFDAARRANVPGMDSVHDDLSPFYDRAQAEETAGDGPGA